MNPVLIPRLESLCARHDEVAALLSEPEVMQDQNRFIKLSQEYAQLEPLIKTWQQFQSCEQSLEEAEAMLLDDDPEMKEMAQEERLRCKSEHEELDQALQILLLPKDPSDDKNIFLEIRAGTGGDEAAIFSGDLFRMYSRYAESQGWQVEIMSESQGEHGGYKEIICRLVGQGVYSKLKFESGAHRVQRVPETESQGRIHTSACTVAVLAEMNEVDSIDINPSDLRIDTFRSSGAGGQHVNTTDSAIRITHLPSGMVVECQDERSQHKNKARAMSLLQARLLEHEQEKQQASQAAERKLQVGSGDRSQRIRTYNFPQGRVTDHRINLTLYRLEEVMAGSLALVLEPLQQEHHAEQLAALSQP